MKSWTIGEMLNERPCAEYPRNRIEDLWSGRERLSLRDILRLDIPASDRIWVVCRPGAMTDEQRAAWLERIVTRSVKDHALNCGILTVEAWARNWLNGSDRSRAEAARAAAETEASWAAREAAAAAAWAAAREAAAAAAWAAETEAEATRAASWAAARAAADAADAAAAAWAAREAAAAEERERQVADALAVMEETTTTEE